jgi:hypothetical protein
MASMGSGVSSSPTRAAADHHNQANSILLGASTASGDCGFRLLRPQILRDTPVLSAVGRIALADRRAHQLRGVRPFFFAHAFRCRPRQLDHFDPYWRVHRQSVVQDVDADGVGRASGHGGLCVVRRVALADGRVSTDRIGPRVEPASRSGCFRRARPRERDRVAREGRHPAQTLLRSDGSCLRRVLRFAIGARRRSNEEWSVPHAIRSTQ